MTYRQLRDMLNGFAEDNPRLDDDVTALLMDSDEVLPVMDFVIDWGNLPQPGYPQVYTTDQKAKGVDQVEGVLDFKHPYLTISF